MWHSIHNLLYKYMTLYCQKVFAKVLQLLQSKKRKRDDCKTLMPPFPNISKIGLTSDLDLWPTDLNINRGHLLINDYLPTKFEASGDKHSPAILCTRCGRPTWPLTFDLNIIMDHLLVVNMLEAIRANVNITLITIVVHIVIHAYTYLLR